MGAFDSRSAGTHFEAGGAREIPSKNSQGYWGSAPVGYQGAKIILDRLVILL